MRPHLAGLRRTRRDDQLSLVLRSLASLESAAYLRAVIADHVRVDYHGECATKPNLSGENDSISHIGCVNDVWHGRPGVPALAVRDQLRPPRRDTVGPAFQMRGSLDTWQ